MANNNLDDLPRSRKEAIERGSKWYFTGQPCKHGHVDKRSTRCGVCYVCNRENARRYCSENRDKQNSYFRAYYAENAPRRLSHTYAWQKSNPDRCSANRQNRRARIKKAEGVHVYGDIARIRKSQKDCCVYCPTKLRGKGHVDHIKALSKGGSNWPRNLQLLCEPCNLSKGSRDSAEFAQSRGLLI